MADAEVQTGAERVVRSNVGRCPRVRVLIPPPAFFRTRYYPSWNSCPPTLLPPLVTNAWSELWATHEIMPSLLRGAPARVIIIRANLVIFLHKGVSSIIIRIISRIRHLNGLSIILSNVWEGSCDRNTFPLQFLFFFLFLALGQK